jgi:hypothetical protein
VQQITTQNVAQLERFVQAGGVLYVSYGGEPWDGRLLALAGVRPRIRYGLADMPAADDTRMRFVASFGGLQPGDVIALRTRRATRRDARLLCEPLEAKTLALDDGGAPALLERRLGAGAVVLATYPLEHYLADLADANEDDESWRIYAALALQSGCRAEIVADHPLVDVYSWRHSADARRLRLVALNHSWVPVEFFLSAPGGLAGSDLESGAPLRSSERCSLPKKGVRVFDMNLD